MTVFADVRCLNMRKIFPRSVGAVVTAHAIAVYVCVVEICRPPRHRRVTIVAIIATADVRRMLAGCRNAIMAGATRADDLGMVDGEHR